MKKRILKTLLWMGSLSLAAAPCRAAETAAASFLEVGVGARAVGMGEAAGTVMDDAGALFWNPAGLAGMGPQSAVFSHAPGIDTVSHEFAAFGINREERGAFALGVHSLSVGDIPRTDENNVSLGRATPRDLAVSAGYAYRLAGRRFPALRGAGVGAAVKYVHSKIVDSAQSFAADAGLLSPPLVHERLRLSLAVKNVGGKMKFDEEKEKLPASVRAGASWKLKRHWVLAADGVFRSEGDPQGAFGMERWFPVGSRLSLAGRLGYNTRGLRGADGLAGASMGVGFLWKSLSVDYAYRFEPEEWDSQAMSVGFRFGGARRGRGLSAHAQALVDEGNRYLEKGMYPEAILKFNEALGEAPNSQDAKDGIQKATQHLVGG